MLSSQLFWRVFGVYAALTMGTALTFATILSFQQRHAVRNEAEEHVRHVAESLAAVLKQQRFEGSNLSPQVVDVLEAMHTREICRVALFGSDRSLLWKSHPADTAWSGELEQIQADLRSPSGMADLPWGMTLQSKAPQKGTGSGGEHLTLRQELKENGTTIGQVMVTLPLNLLFQDLSTVQTQLWAAAVTFGVLALAVTYIVVGRIIGPLETLTDAARQIVEGRMPGEVAVRSRNEIGTLANVFNTMSRELSARISDLEEQRRQQEANHQQLETVLGAMLEGIIAVDAEERILFANNAAIRLMDLKPLSLVGRPIWEAIRQESLHDLVRQAVAEGGLKKTELELARTQSTFAVTASRLPGDPVPGAVIVFHDVTELRRLETLRRDFVQNVSHELKTPLSSISAYADTLLDGGLEDEACNRQFVEKIAEQADRLHRLILDLLALARMESADDGFEVEPVDVSRVLTTSIDAHAGVAQAKRISLVAEAPAQPVFGLADDEGLRTIIDNLLDNALNYTPDGGTVTVRWKLAGTRVRIQVQDTGAGIAREHQQRIFQRFYRIDKARSRELGGTGLGLSIVKHLCQVFGGSVSVNSQLGLGSTFTVELQSAADRVALTT